MPLASVVVSSPIVGKRPPGWVDVSPAQYPLQSLSLSWSWGSEPSEANAVYISTTPVTVGSAVRITVGAYRFHGVCQRDVPLVSSHGNTRQLSFKDYREWLKWDKIYAAFNFVEDRLINGYRRKRYRHVLPWNFGINRPFFTDAPLSAATIMQYCFNAPGIETPWRVAYLDNAGALHDLAYHPNLGGAVYDVDCLTGKPFGTLLAELAAECGLLYTFMPDGTDPDKLFRLTFAQKGVDGPDVALVGDDREDGIELSGNPTRVRVLGDANAYQVADIQLVPDWSSAWNQFFSIDLFVEYIFQNYITWDAGSDPDQIIARQQALSLALEMTVGQFAFQEGDNSYRDGRKYAGKNRNDLPAALYISQILFRCFRLPDGFYFWNTYGGTLYRECLDVRQNLVASVTHNPTTGVTSWDSTTSVDGNAYVIVRGYQVGKDLFESIKPERFNLAEWTGAQDIWQKIDVNVQNSDDYTGPVIVFDEPVIRSADLVTMVDGYGVFIANPTFTVPAVRATLCFSAEKFSWFQTLILDASAPPSDPVMGTQVHDEILNISGLGGEFIVAPGGALTEVPYADGLYCRTKAIRYANNFLNAQFLHRKGRFREPIMDTVARSLHGKIDRISLEHGPGGSTASVELTNEQGRVNFMPERDLDRMNTLRQLVPGEKELRKQSETARKIAGAARQSKEAYKLLSEAFTGQFGQRDLAKPTVVKPCATALVAAGSVFVKEPNLVSAGIVTQTRPLLQAHANPDYVQFAGLTVRDGEKIDPVTGATLRLQSTGEALALVRGPITIGQTLLTAPDTSFNYLFGDDTSETDSKVVAGTALQAIDGEAVKLIRVLLGASAGGPTIEMEDCRTGKVYLVQGKEKPEE